MDVGVAGAGMCLLKAVIALLLLSQGGFCDASKPEAAMYSILHDLALPHLNPNEKVTERFVLLQPGEVLDPYEYMPVNESAAVFSDPLRLPPDEKMFRLSDTVPTLNPLGGGTTGKSLSTIYSNILYSIDTTTVKEDPFTNENYLAAVKYLQAEVPDPDGETGSNVTRSELYHRYKERYYDAKQMVSQWLEANKTGTELEYEEWYKASYDTLEAFTSNAYSQWLIDGMKGEVEDRLSVVDIKSVRSEIEDAKALLRNEELPSRDGGSKYYPVHFIPSNWYKYLLAV